jgi:hypothetical protein
MTIQTTTQTIEVSDIGSVTITDTMQTENEQEETVYRREIRIYSNPVNSQSNTLLFTLVLIGDTENSIELQAPAQTF